MKTFFKNVKAGFVSVFFSLNMYVAMAFIIMLVCGMYIERQEWLDAFACILFAINAVMFYFIKRQDNDTMQAQEELLGTQEQIIKVLTEKLVEVCKERDKCSQKSHQKKVNTEKEVKNP